MILCSNPECHTTAGCKCIKESSGNVFADLGLKYEAKALEIMQKNLPEELHRVGLVRDIAKALMEASKVNVVTRERPPFVFDDVS